jgi:hypothetical protein
MKRELFQVFVFFWNCVQHNMEKEELCDEHLHRKHNVTRKKNGKIYMET